MDGLLSDILSSKQASNITLLYSYSVLIYPALHCSALLYKTLHCIDLHSPINCHVDIIFFERKSDEIGEIPLIPDLNPSGCTVEDISRF